MRNFFIGVAATLAVLIGGSYLYLRMGFLNSRADLQPSAFEKRNPMAFMDASADRHAPDEKNPIQPTEANLTDGVKLYKTHCAACHGAPDHPERQFGHPFYPPAPDMPENQNFYVIPHGVRWTGMPAQKNTLRNDEIWKLVTFLDRTDKLPPAVEEEWKRSAPPAGDSTRKSGQGRSPHARRAAFESDFKTGGIHE